MMYFTMQVLCAFPQSWNKTHKSKHWVGDSSEAGDSRGGTSSCVSALGLVEANGVC